MRTVVDRIIFLAPQDDRFFNLTPQTIIAENSVKCACDCGHDIVVTCNHLAAGIVPACECVEDSHIGRLQHGYSRNNARATEHNIWRAMKARCNRPTHPCYKTYGGRGITVCPEWQESFAQFLADMGPRPRGLTLERIDNDRGYSPDNCKWATIAEQSSNRGYRAARYRLDPDKAREIRELRQTLAVKELALRYGCSISAIYNVIYNRRWKETSIAA